MVDDQSEWNSVRLALEHLKQEARARGVAQVVTICALAIEHAARKKLELEWFRSGTRDDFERFGPYA